MPDIYALLAAMAADREAKFARVATGEPCRCPEHVLDCVCGAYTGSAVVR